MDRHVRAQVTPGQGRDVAAATAATAVKAFIDFLSEQASATTALTAMATDNSKFPDGQWPDPATSTFNDGSVTDGDGDWSLNA
ncbi:hypothetical protein JOF56_006295 [Kibdelosporangium banguiense]|uniref:Uncharacterized protein n=1 Tax=Kibdelosporangium banguiense TaxID=1365924 RepID=A0ABS4TPL5_9PSEU|nr:hypothetical protein [Kibdelosporangium banguiense]MBP2325910.1 hypothetical protein [Kibdelosporangium banguiense]